MKTRSNRNARWLYPFAALGVISAGHTAVSLFSALGRRPSKMWTDERPPVDTDEFLKPLAGILGVPLVTGGTVKLLNNGNEWLDSLLADFAAAQESITFSAYMWEPGKLNDLLFDALIERARAGVQVRVLVDGVGGKKCPEEDAERLRAAGGELCIFRPVKFGKLDHVHLRNHRRAIVIDGRIGYTGGMAVHDQWLGNARNNEEWRDIMVRVTGLPARSVQSAFAELWAYVCGEVLSGSAYFPTDLEENDSEMRSLAVVSSPAPEEQPLHLLFFKSFLSARKRIWITTPYFVPAKPTLDELARQARNGVDVRLLLPSKHTDSNAVRWAGQSVYEPLLEAGVRIFEYQPTMIHAKTVVIDSVWSIVGSANLDIRSMELNEENVLGILDRGFAAELERAFERDLQRACEIMLNEWKRRGIGARLVERCAGLLSEQY